MKRKIYAEIVHNVDVFVLEKKDLWDLQGHKDLQEAAELEDFLVQKDCKDQKAKKVHKVLRDRMD